MVLPWGGEFGALNDPASSDLDRIAVSASVGYNSGDGIEWNVKGEARFENSEDSVKNSDTYLISAGYTNKVNDNWLMLANVDALISNSDQSDFLDGYYIEGSLGFAYRPVDNDRFNALVKYTYLEDLPGVDQVTVNGTTAGPRQRSHIFSADVSYDLNERMTIGGKYGTRIGKVSTDRTSDTFTDSIAHLSILRADYHILKKWDVLVEGRVLASPSTDTVDYGALAALYYHSGKNMKVGVGYNFGSFSDDLRDITYDDGGVFLNAI